MESKLRVLSIDPWIHESNSPLATIEDIHKRLTRPQQSSSSVIAIASHLSNLDTSPLQKRRKLTRLPHQQSSSSSVIASHLYELQHDKSVDTSPLPKRRKSRAVKVRLEDYFDLSLLSETRAKMNSFLNKQSRKMKLKSEFEEFVWPAAGDHHDSELFSENSRRIDEAIVDLKNDDDSFVDAEENHVCCVDPFQRFESTALMRFKR